MARSKPLVRWQCDGCREAVEHLHEIIPAGWRSIRVHRPKPEPGLPAILDMMNKANDAPESQIDLCGPCFKRVNVFIHEELGKK